jgi:hypothetical protein
VQQTVRPIRVPQRDVAGACASLPTVPLGRVPTLAENAGFSRNEGEIRREADCLLEGDGFEPSVLRRKKKVCYERKRFQPVYSRECGAAKSAVLRFGRPGSAFRAITLGYGFVVLCRDGGRIRRAGGANPTLKFPSRAASQRYAQVIAVVHTHLGAGVVVVQPFFFCASYTPPSQSGARRTPLWFRLSAPQSCRDASEIAGFRAAVLKVRIHLPPAESPQTFGSCSRRAANSFHPRIPDAASGSVAGGLRYRSRSGGRLVERAVHLLERAALGFWSG